MLAWLILLASGCAGTESGNPTGPLAAGGSGASGPGFMTPTSGGPDGSQGETPGSASTPPPAGGPNVSVDMEGSANGPDRATCSDGWGGCEVTPEGQLCSCTYYQANRTTTSSSCKVGLSLCKPEAYLCQDYTGFCEPVTGGFSCQCVGAARVLFSSATHGTDCAPILANLCGNTVIPPEHLCEGSRETGAESRVGRCARDYQGLASVFRCTCQVTNDTGTGFSSATTVDATKTCADTLEDLCLAQP